MVTEHKAVEKTIIDVLNKNNSGIKIPADFPLEGDLFVQGIIDSFGIIHFVAALQKTFYPNGRRFFCCPCESPSVFSGIKVFHFRYQINRRFDRIKIKYFQT